MNTDKHVVTLPIEDYNELMKLKDFSGIQKLSWDSPIGIQLQKSHLDETGNYKGELKDQIEYFYRFK
jgi:hypothetical protein